MKGEKTGTGISLVTKLEVFLKRKEGEDEVTGLMEEMMKNVVIATLCENVRRAVPGPW